MSRNTHPKDDGPTGWGIAASWSDPARSPCTWKWRESDDGDDDDAVGDVDYDDDD